jgi:hypothetical protein
VIIPALPAPKIITFRETALLDLTIRWNTDLITSLAAINTKKEIRK